VKLARTRRHRAFAIDLGEHCRLCGCTEFTACAGAFGEGCHWVKPGVCSECVDPPAASTVKVRRLQADVERPRRRRARSA
jgi:hypothetical protein